MKRILAIVGLVCLCATATTADVPKPKSTGFSFDKTGVSVTYLNDGKHYGLAVGSEIGRQGRLVAQGWLTFEPVNKSQVGLAATVGYDMPIGKSITLTPLAGVMQPVTDGLDGRAGGKFIVGGSLSIRF